MAGAEQINYLKNVFGNVDGYAGLLLLSYQNGESRCVGQRMLLAEDIAEYDIPTVDAFVTLNTFSSKTRRKEELVSLNALYLDIDTYSVGKDSGVVLAEMRKNDFGKTIPYPTYVVSSGLGLYLIWKIAPEGPEKEPVWGKTMRKLYSNLAHYGADNKALDAPRVLRVPGTVNTKRGDAEPVCVIEQHETDYLLDFIDDWVKNTKAPRKPAEPAKKAVPSKRDAGTRTAKPRKTGDRPRVVNKKVAAMRAEDIETLLLDKGEDVVGYREVGLFLYRHNLSLSGVSFDIALAKTLELNSRLAIPLSEREASQATRTAPDKVYGYSNTTLIALFDISPETQTQMKTIFSKEEKARRRRLGYGRNISRAEETAQKKKRITELRASGKTIAQVCAEMGISKATYYNLTKGRRKVSAQKTVATEPVVQKKIRRYRKKNTFRVIINRNIVVYKGSPAAQLPARTVRCFPSLAPDRSSLVRAGPSSRGQPAVFSSA